MHEEDQMRGEQTTPWNETARDADDRDLDEPADASEVEGGAATGAIVGTALGGPAGLAVGAAAGALAGGATEAVDDADRDQFERTPAPDAARGLDLRDPRMGGHVGGSDPENA